MNDTPTPRTDAEHAQFPMGGFTLDFTRQLERELTAAREEIKELNDKLDDAVADATNAVNDIIRMKWQRDRLAELLRKIKNAGGTYDDPYDELDFIDGITYDALQSLTTPKP